MPLKENLSRQLKRYRALQAQSIVEFSASLGVAKSTLQELEAGRGNPTLETIDLMEQKLNLAEGTLLSPDAPSPKLTALLSAVPALRELPPDKRRGACELLLQLAALYDEGSGGP